MFDFVLLGLGADTHVVCSSRTSAGLGETNRLAAANHEKRGTDRITLTLPALCNARSVVIMATWEEKAEAVREVCSRSRSRGPSGPSRPAHEWPPYVGVELGCSRDDFRPSPTGNR